MKKNLGLDVGTNSVGWALVIQNDDSDDLEIVDMGVRIISSDPSHANNFEKGRPVELNVARRKNRGIRRSYQRRKLRNRQLNAVLKCLNMMPDDVLLRGIKAVDLYGLRDKALTEQLALAEIGRIFIQIGQRRGYKSNRKTDGADDKNEKEVAAKSKEKTDKKESYVEEIQRREAEIQSLGLTIGQFFFQKLSVDEHFRVKKQIFTRAAYEAEFEAIWNAQAKFYPHVLTEANREIIQHKILFYQRALKSQKHLVTPCSMEKNLKAMPKSAPLFQISKVLQTVNNMKITNAKRANTEGFDRYGERELTADERRKAIHFLENEAEGRPLTGEKFLTEVISPTFAKRFGYKLNLIKVEYNTTRAAFRKVFDDYKYNGASILNNSEAFDALWHKVYSIEEPERLLKILTLTEKDIKPDENGVIKMPSVFYRFSEKMANDFVNMRLTAEYGSLSAKAVKKLMPFLEKGLNYVDACQAVFNTDNLKNLAYNKHHETKADKRERELATQIKLLKKGAMRNPVVEQIVNQVINIVNKMIHKDTPQYVTDEERKNGDFEIRVELARSLQQDAESRQKDTKRMGENSAYNDKIRERLKEEHVPQTLRNIEKYKLWKQQGEKSPYSGDNIELADLFNTGLYEVDHIIAQSRYFDDSLTNKVVVETALNGEKGKKLAFEFMQHRGVVNGENQLERFIKYVNDNTEFTTAKKKRLLAVEIPEENVSRQLKETQYITKTLTTKLREICHDDRVTVTSGAVTSYLREIWGLNSMIQKLNWERYEEEEQIVYVVRETAEVVTKQEAEVLEAAGQHIITNIKDWTKRVDHRHHAVDALVIACTKQGMIQKLNTLRSQNIDDAQRPKFLPPLTPCVRSLLKKNINFDDAKHKRDKMVEAFVIDATIATDSILVSHRQKRKVVSSGKNKITKGKGSNKVTIHEQKNLLTPRGQLHKDSVFGQRFKMVTIAEAFRQPKSMADAAFQSLIINRLKNANNDPDLAMLNYRKNPIWTDEAQTKPLRHVAVGAPIYVIKYPLDGNISNDKIEGILDKTVKDLVIERLKGANNVTAKAFGDLETNPLYLNKEKGIRIRTVTCASKFTNATPIHRDENGKDKDYVILGNNHLIAIYEDEKKIKRGQGLTFWEATERLSQKTALVEPEDPEFGKWVMNIMKGDMFLLDLPNKPLPEDIDITNSKNRRLLSKHLFKVNSISVLPNGAVHILFFHHIETNADIKGEKYGLKTATGRVILAQSIGTLFEKHPIKVYLNNLGKIEKASS
jgi:CRISPR-associated endonuclease Csn1